MPLAPEALGKDERGRNETPALQGSGLWAHLPVFPAVPCQCLECGRFEVTPASQVRVSGCWSFSIFDAHDLFEQFLFYLCAQFEAPGRLEVLLYFRIAIPDGSSRYYSSRIQNFHNLTTHSQSRHKHDFKYGCS